MSFVSLVYIESTTSQPLHSEVTLGKWMLDRRGTLLFPKDMDNQPEKYSTKLTVKLATERRALVNHVMDNSFHPGHL